MTAVAYKLADRAEWDVARPSGAYAGSVVDQADGFIHLSTAEQLAETARRHYRDRMDLVLATVDLTALGAALRWEPSRGGALFPHLYAPLPFEAVQTERGLAVDAEGLMHFTDGAVGWP